MALSIKDRVRESSTTTGTGTVTLNGAYTGYRSFSSAISDGDTVYYVIHNTESGFENEFEVGLGTYNSSTITRDIVLQSTQNGEKINLAGSGAVFITYPADKAVFKDENDRIPVGSSGIIFSDSTIQTTAAVKNDQFTYVSGIANYASGQSVIANSYINIDSDFSVSNNDHKIFANTSLNSINVYIPTASGVGGKEYVIKKTIGNNEVNVIPSGLETIDGQNSQTILTEYRSLTIVSDNTNWLIT